MATGRNPPYEAPRREPWYRREYESTLRRVLRDGTERSAKFKIFEIVAAFLTMRRHEAGIDARRNRLQARTFEIQTLQNLALYIPGKSSVTDGLLEVAAMLEGKDIEGAQETIRHIIDYEKKRVSNDQSRRAKLPRPGLFSRYLKEILKARPNITLSELRNQIEKDSGGSVIGAIEPNGFEVKYKPDPDIDKEVYEDVPWSGLKDRLFRAQKKLMSR